MKRRQFLAAGTTLSLAVAGCIGSDDGAGPAFRVSLLGQTAEEVSVDSSEAPDIERTVAAELDIETTEVAALPSANAVELRRADGATSEFAAALSATELTVDSEDIRSGVTEMTAEQARDAVRNRFERADIDGDVELSSGDTEPVLTVDADEEHHETIPDLLDSQNQVRVMLGVPNEDPNATEPETEVLLEADDFERVSEPKSGDASPSVPHVEVQLTADATERFQQRLVETGFTQEGTGGSQACRWEEGAEPAPDQYCLYTMNDDKVVSAAGLNAEFARALEAGTFDGGYIITASSTEEAQEISTALRGGTLPTDVDIERLDE